MWRLLLISLTAFAFAACSDKRISTSEVPKVVISSFKDKYPNASNVQWEEESTKGKCVYDAAFRMNGKEVDAQFCEDGTFLQEE